MTSDSRDPAVIARELTAALGTPVRADDPAVAIVLLVSRDIETIRENITQHQANEAQILKTFLDRMKQSPSGQNRQLLNQVRYLAGGTLGVSLLTLLAVLFR
ncbi:MAG: hypothetical protein ACK5HY_01360 [Parahaliea sp.]